MDLRTAAAIYAGVVLFGAILLIPRAVNKPLKTVTPNLAALAIIVDAVFLAAVVVLANYANDHFHKPLDEVLSTLGIVLLILAGINWSLAAIRLVGKRRKVVTHEMAEKKALGLMMLLAFVVFLSAA